MTSGSELSGGGSSPHLRIEMWGTRIAVFPGKLLFLLSESYPMSSDQFSRYFFISAMNLPASAPSMMR